MAPELDEKTSQLLCHLPGGVLLMGTAARARAKAQALQVIDEPVEEANRLR
jgi:hypothetical protein